MKRFRPSTLVSTLLLWPETIRRQSDYLKLVLTALHHLLSMMGYVQEGSHRGGSSASPLQCAGHRR